MPELLTPQEVANYFHVKLNTIYTWVYQGKLKKVKIYGRLLFRAENILELVERE